MRAASPPANTADLLDTANNRRNRPGIKRSMMAKQSSLDDVGLELDSVEQEEDFEGSSGAAGEGSSSRWARLRGYRQGFFFRHFVVYARPHVSRKFELDHILSLVRPFSS